MNSVTIHFEYTETGTISVLDAQHGLTTYPYVTAAERMQMVDNLTFGLEERGLKMVYRHREVKEDGITPVCHQLWVPK